MKKAIGSLLGIIVLAAVAFAVYLWLQGPTYRPASPPPLDAPPPAAAAEPEILYPMPEPPPTALPAPDKSDPAVLGALSELLGRAAVKRLFQPEEIVRRIVVTVDNLPRKVVSGQLMPTTPVPGKLNVSGKGKEVTLSSANYERYTPFVRVLNTVDAKGLAALYTRFYPLFQGAYRDLGYPKGYFNDRLVAVIDHMLDAPEVEGPIELVQPHVFYKFADPELESLSAGHKLMLRMGDANAAKVKRKLQEIRKELVKGSAEAKGR
ncbi:DUF3014 domain-containing protein [Noviherbaspirillum aerium]|uniref:DUF3014 domain-containing protein n=1 Tax=Noviherbaspirillum aerium TaxID=2588497 RepID=UPI00124D0E76|nr:DUF3014 domain-containing protein [Noviherbaspirillum aerium]